MEFDQKVHYPEDIKINEEDDGIFKIGTELNETILDKLLQNKVNLITISKTNSINKGPYILQTLFNDKNENKNDAITEIYKMLTRRTSNPRNSNTNF